MDEMFTYQELRITLTAFAMWFAEQNGLTLLDPTAATDRFIEETTQ